MKKCKKALSLLLCLLMLVTMIPAALATEAEEATAEETAPAAETSAEEAAAEEAEPAQEESTEKLIEDQAEEAPQGLSTVSVVITSANFPDENFCSYVKSQFDTDGNGTLSAAELEEVRKINVAGKEIADLTGIEYFTALTFLNCDVNNLTSLDLSKNTALTKLYCSQNKLTGLDLRSNTALTHLTCRYTQLTSLDLRSNTALTDLSCSDNQLTSLNISGCSALISLRCNDNAITELDLSQNTKLQTLYCQNNLLTALDLSRNFCLNSLTCFDNEIEALDISATSIFLKSGGSNLYQKGDYSIYMTASQNEYFQTYVYYTSSDYWRGTVIIVPDVGAAINETNFPDSYFRTYVSNTFDVDANDFLHPAELLAVEEIACTNSNIKSLKGIEYFTNLKTLNLSGCTSLNSLDIDDNALTSLDVSGCSALTTLNCSNNRLESLNVSGCPKLTSLLCYNNSLINLDLSGCPKLTGLDCSGNAIGNYDTELDLSGNPELTYLNCSGNRLSKLDITGTKVCTGNAHAYFGAQQYVTGITVTMDGTQKAVFDANWKSDDKNAKVNYNDGRFEDPVFRSFMLAYFDSDKDGWLSPAECAAVEDIDDFYGEGVKSLKGIELFPNLLSLNCADNEITELDLSSNTKLQKLNCGGNQLTKLDLSHNPELTRLYCQNNQLTELDLSANTKLNDLDCRLNRLTCLDISGTQVYLVNTGSYLGNQKEAGSIAVTMTPAQLAAYSSKYAEDPNNDRVIIAGDVDGDGSVNLPDVSLLFRHVSGRETASAVVLSAADVNCDGKVNLRDVAALFKLCAK